MRHKLVIASSLMLLVMTANVYALNVEQPLPVAEQETRAQALFHEIRCVVCQSESIADSPAQIAGDMRRLVRAHVAMGDSNEAVKAYLVSRYGDMVLMNPPLNQTTLILWFGPLVILLLAFLVVRGYFRQQKIHPDAL